MRCVCFTTLDNEWSRSCLNHSLIIVLRSLASHFFSLIVPVTNYEYAWSTLTVTRQKSLSISSRKIARVQLHLLGRQGGRVVSVSDSQSSGPGFKSRSDHYLDLFLGSPEFKSSAMLVNSQLVCLRPVGILNNVIFNLNHLFQLFARPH